jgi:hypothetical protein
MGISARNHPDARRSAPIAVDAALRPGWLAPLTTLAAMLDLDACLERIGLDGRPSIAQLHRAHLTSIPFENLDPHQGLPVSLEVEDLERKLVTERRGGYCFEQNLLLKAALEALGAEVDIFLARMRLGAKPGVFEDYMAERVRELAETQAALPDDAPLETRARALADQWMDRLARDRESVLLHMEFIAHASRDRELARRFGTRSAAMRDAVARYIAHYQEEAGAELPVPADDLALVLRALGIGLAVESLVSPDAVRKNLYGDFVELLVTMMRDGGSAEPPSRRQRGAKP